MLTLFRNIFAPPRDLILIVAAGWLGLALADARARDSTIGEKNLDTVLLSAALAFILGGRLVFLAMHFSAFAASPLSLFSLNTSAFDTLGALACAAITALAVMQRRHLPVLTTLDLATPALAALAIGLSLSHLASGAAFGAQAQLPWSIQLWGALRHPTQVYELFAASITLAVIWFRRSRSRPGGVFLLWLALASASRLIIEGFRGDSTLAFGGLRLAQITAWLLLAAALIGLELLPRPATNPVVAEAEPVPPAGTKRKRTAVKKGNAP